MLEKINRISRKGRRSQIIQLKKGTLLLFRNLRNLENSVLALSPGMWEFEFEEIRESSKSGNTIGF
jgi:hypothetical protein